MDACVLQIDPSNPAIAAIASLVYTYISILQFAIEPTTTYTTNLPTCSRRSQSHERYDVTIQCYSVAPRMMAYALFNSGIETNLSSRLYHTLC